jgi:hypothetical protein
VSRRAIVDPEKPWLHMTDFSVYTEAGAAFFDGRPPYEVQNVRGWRYIYPPLFALLVAPLSQISPPAQAAVWFAISVLLSLGVYFESRKLLAGILSDTPRSRKIAWQLGLVAGVTVLFPLLNCLQRGQLGVALLYPLFWGFRLVLLGQRRSAWFAGGVILALPVILKLTPVLPVGCLLVAVAAAWRGVRVASFTRPSLSVAIREGEADRLLRSGDLPPVTRTWQGPACLTAGVLSGAALFALLIPSALVGWQANLGHLHTWYTRVATKVNHDRTDQFAENGCTFRNQSLSNAVHRFGNWVGYVAGAGPDDRLIDTTVPEMGSLPMDHWLVDPSLVAARGAATLILLLTVAALGRRGDSLSLGFALGLACVATLIVSPVARGHYFLLYLPALLFGGTWMLDHRPGKTATIMNLTPLALCVIHYTALEYAGRIGLLGIGTTVWFFAACGIVLAETRHASQVATVEIPKDYPRRAAA